MSTAATLPDLLEGQAVARPTRVALRQKRLGIWQEITWHEYAETVRAVALALDADGIGPGQGVAVFADNEPRWLYADLGIQTVGAATAALYAALGSDDAVSAVRTAGAKIVFCGDQEQVDKLLETEDGTAGIERLVLFDLKGLHTPEYAALPIESFEDFLARGRALAGSAQERLAEMAAGRNADQVASLSMTSGTSGPARLVALSQSGQVELARISAAELGFTERDQGYALLPLANATSRVIDAYAPLVAGSSLAFPESHETVPQDMVEAAPTVLVASPRLLERTRGEIELRAGRAGWLKRRVATWGLRRLGTAAGAPRGGAGAPFADLLVGRFVRAKAGLAHVRLVAIGGAPVADRLLGWFRALGVPVREIYGQTEAGGPVAIQRTPADAGTAGRPLGTIELRVEGEELLVRSPGVIVDGAGVEDGWLRTGDLARLDEDGRLLPLGRASDRIVTASGEDVVPSDTENALRGSPYVATAMMVNAGRPFPTALLELDTEAVADWARRTGVPITTYAALATNDHVIALLARELETANAALPESRQVRAFRVLPRPLVDELTPTGKIKRAVVEAEYRDLIDEMYEGGARGTS